VDSVRCEAADILIVGAGPSGAAAARILAAQGRDVLLIDRCTFPRDKICGDALIPDALNALGRLGLDSQVRSESRPSSSVRVYAPHGGHVSADVALGCVPRRRLDDILLQGAVASGARFAAPYTLTHALEREGHVVGAGFAQRGGGHALTVHANYTLLATGAALRPLELFSVAERRTASALAVRIYVHTPEHVADATRHFSISIDRTICPGYGWIFPGPGGVFNLGVGYFTDPSQAPPATNPRALLARFLASFAPARDIMSQARSVSDVRGAPLRTALTGAALARPGLLVIGEAAGLTYPFTGEGIGKAIESGIMAGEILSRVCGTSQAARDAAAHEYAATIRARFGARFRAYQLAQRWLSRPLLSDFLAWRGGAGTYVSEQLRSMLLETADPRALFSCAGVLRALVR
jgi:geranylgeranyl reductase family protein